ncbi:hypothetical protein [Chloroflexus sp.]|uniref:hypothetical protein n=1 Tax=Chloroflexus sp. TaxID=1904827 RepID=UPI003C70B79B
MSNPSSIWQLYRIFVFIGGWLVTLIVVSNWSTEAGQAAVTLVVVPSELETIRGERIGQLAALHDAELNEWAWEPETAYMRFGITGAATGHESILTYTVPVSVALTAVNEMGLLVNWRGPTASEQRWWWEVRNVQTGQWYLLGDNTNGQTWRWTTWSLGIPLSPVEVIDDERHLFIRYQADNNSNESALDQLVIELTVNGVPSGTVTPAPTSSPSGVNVYLPCIAL